MKKIDREKCEVRSGASYPPPFDVPCRERMRLRLAKSAGLTQFGVNELHLAPGAWSSQRHWHLTQDEFIFVMKGEVVLVTNAGEEVLRAGDSAAFKAGDADGHCLQNRSGAEAVVLEVGSTVGNDLVDYPDIDLRASAAGYVHRDGRAY
jgi:uncharacterized cupin superfamily protein